MMILIWYAQIVPTAWYSFGTPLQFSIQMILFLQSIIHNNVFIRFSKLQGDEELIT